MVVGTEGRLLPLVVINDVRGVERIRGHSSIRSLVIVLHERRDTSSYARICALF